ncbi:MAG: DUF1080 domain-containing protein [Akkermansiaceae bacterium]|nr:DUF1080 domain-containing protein [Akkermansiaceae bacterium]
MHPLISCFCLLLGGALLLPQTAVAENTEAALEFFLPDEETAKRLQPTIDQLESESFAEREAASRRLAALPALPGFIRELAVTEARPESRFRLGELLAAFPIEEENERLTAILEQIAKDGTKGLLPSLFRVMAAGVWEPDPVALHSSARATATPTDLALLDGHLRDPSAVLRRLAAAALGGLPAGDSTARLAGLLGDTDQATVLLAATELAARRDLRSLAAFAGLLDAPDFQFRHRCHTVLRGLTQQDFGYDPGADQMDRKGPAAKWRKWAESKGASITGIVPVDFSIVLFNGRNLDGWEVRVGNELQARSEAWEVMAGQLHCVGRAAAKPGDLWTKTRFENYVLNLEYKADEPRADSGIGLLLTKEGEQGQGLSKYLEVQLLPGNGGDIYQIGGVNLEAGGKPITFQQPRLAEVEDRAGVWHPLKLTVRDGTVEVVLDGVVVNRTSKGPRGPGRIVLRNEGSKLTFRKLVLYPLRGAAGAPGNTK